MLVQLAKFRAALTEARVTSAEPGSPDSSLRRARAAIHGTQKLPSIEPADQGALYRLETLLNERARSTAPDRVEILDREIERLALEREVIETARLAEASRRVRTTGLQTVFLISAIGLLAAGATAFAFRPLR
jgi:hypothetical protein